MTGQDNRRKIHFVTGRLAADALTETVASLALDAEFDYSIDVLPITVAALMTPDWIARHIAVPPDATEVLIPGYCGGEFGALTSQVQLPVMCGPRDLRELPTYFGRERRRDDYGAHDIQIIAEINHAPRLKLDDILKQARELSAAGADLIDVGCDPDGPWFGVGDCVRALRDSGHRVSIDSLDPREIAPAVGAGAELVLSVDRTNREHAVDWGCEVVVVPDEIGSLVGLEENLEWLDQHDVHFRIDPILEPIGFGFTASLSRYLDVHRRFPTAEIMMGVGNLTELTDVDSAGINTLLLGFCQELGIRSVLTTQVIPWARTSVRECDLARRLMYYAVKHRVVPKHLEPRLVCLRDDQLFQQGNERLATLASEIRDHGVRLYAEEGRIHALCDGVQLKDADPFVVFDQLLAKFGDRIDVSHAFYLGYEMAKAATALTLGKQYRQDESLDWGYLTVAEVSQRSRRDT